MEKKSFIVHEQWVNMFVGFPDADVGAIFKGMMRYTMTGEIGEVTPMQKGILSMMIEVYEADKEKYEETCRKRREAVEKRWNKSIQSNTTVCNSIQTDTNVYKCIQNDTDKDKELDKDKDKDRDMDKDKDKDMDMMSFPSESPKEKGDFVSQREVVERIVERWNNLPDCIPKVKNIDMKSERFKMLKERLKTYTEQDVMDAIGNIETSPFLLGDNKNRWVIKFDWFVRPNNFPKVFEGQYNTGRTTVMQPKVARGISIVDEMIARGEL